MINKPVSSHGSMNVSAAVIVSCAIISLSRTSSYTACGARAEALGIFLWQMVISN